MFFQLFKTPRAVDDLESRGDGLDEEEEEERDDVDLEVVVSLGQQRRRRRLPRLQPELGVEGVGGVLGSDSIDIWDSGCGLGTSLEGQVWGWT